jgi:hypothetical protein
MSGSRPGFRKVALFVVMTVASCGGVLASPSGVDGGPPDGPPDDPGRAGSSGSSGTGSGGPTGFAGGSVSSATGTGAYAGKSGYAGQGAGGYAGGFGGRGYGGYAGYGGAGYAGGFGGYGGTGYAGGFGGYGGTGFGGQGSGGKAGRGGYAGGAGRPQPPSRCFGPIADPVEVTFPVISKFDGDAGTAVEAVTPGGIWAPDHDGVGAISLKVEPCGTGGNGLHFVGRGHTTWGADVAAAFSSLQQPVDASRYSGISFVIRSSASIPVIVKLQNLDSDPVCGRCDDTVLGGECYAGYMKAVTATTSGIPFSLRWSDFVAPTWGYHWPGQSIVDPKELVSIAFAFDRAVDFDVCIDDVVFNF